MNDTNNDKIINLSKLILFILLDDSQSCFVLFLKKNQKYKINIENNIIN